MTDELESASLSSRRWMAAVGALQGAVLWAIFRERDVVQPMVAVLAALGFFVITASLVLHLANDGTNPRRMGALALGTGLLFGLLGFLVGVQLPAEGVSYDGDSTRIVSWVLLSVPTLYIAMPFLQIYQRTGRFDFDYGELFRFSWNNFFIASLAILYTSALWLVLLLWAELFDLIGIDFFEDLFERSSFIWIVSGAALAYGIAAARESDRVIGTLRGVVRSLFQAVFPLLTFVTILFAASVCVTGLDPLFETRSATWIVAWWLAAGILFLNAVYGDGSHPPPYPRLLRLCAEAGTLVLPFLAAIGLYATWLRINQHGLTPYRVYALVGLFCLALYAVGYAVAVLRRGEPWIPFVKSVNRGMSIVLIGLGIALHTPILDPIRLSLHSQLGRLADGTVATEDFDYGHLRFELGRLGFEALQRLAREAPVGSVADERITLALHVENSWDLRVEKDAAREAVSETLVAPAGGAEIPRELRLAVKIEARSNEGADACGRPQPCVAFTADIVKGGGLDWIVVGNEAFSPTILVFSTTDTDGDVLRFAGTLAFSTRERDRRDEVERLRRAEVETSAPIFNDLRVGEARLRFTPR